MERLANVPFRRREPVPPPRATARYPRQRTTEDRQEQPNDKKMRRMKTVSELPIDGQLPTSLNALQQAVYQEVISRMRKTGLNLAAFSKQAFHFMLPHSTSVTAYWNQLLQFPMTVSDDELRALLRMQDSTDTTPKPGPGAKIYYVRSFTIKVKVLLAVTQKWEEEMMDFEEVAQWKEQMEYIADEEMVISVRYVGMSGVTSGWGRFADDLKYRTAGVYANFVNTLAQIEPGAVMGCKVYEFPQAETRALRDADDVLYALDTTQTDAHEQALIALLGKNTLLNRQPGGHHTSYSPSDSDMSLFMSLKTTVFEQFSSQSPYYEDADLALKHQVNAHIHKVVKLGKDHPQELGTDRIPPSDEMERAWSTQAMPAKLYGEVFVVMIGDYTPLDAMYNPLPYWTQDHCRSVRYLKDILARLRHLERGLDRGWHPSNVNEVSDAALLPWVDWQYTPKRDAFRPESAELLRQYLSIVKPLIVPTFERATSGVIRANFAGTWAFHDFHPEVGVPAVQYWTDPGAILGAGNKSKRATNDPRPEDCFIQIPMYHTGLGKYTSQPIELQRVADMSAWQLLLLMDVALRIVPGWDGTRADLCDQILAGFESRWEESGCNEVFTRAKADLASIWATKAGRYSKEEKRQWRPSLQGQSVAVNMSGHVNLYWKKADGTTQRIRLQGGRQGTLAVPAVDKDTAIRTVHFLNTGIDVRDGNGESTTYTRFRRVLSNPSFPGYIIREKLGEKGIDGIVELWEYETGLSFEDTFPSEAPAHWCEGCVKGNVECEGYAKGKPCRRCKSKKVVCKPQTPKDSDVQKLPKKRKTAPPVATGEPDDDGLEIIDEEMFMDPPLPAETYTGKGKGRAGGPLKRPAVSSTSATFNEPGDDDLYMEPEGEEGLGQPKEESARPARSGGTRKRKAPSKNTVASVAGKCQLCRLAGVACVPTEDGECQRCSSKGLLCSLI